MKARSPAGSAGCQWPGGCPILRRTVQRRLDKPLHLTVDTPKVLSEPLWQEAYAELKRLASARLYAAGPLTQLDTTALVNESYLKLAERAGSLEFPSRNHFFAYASKVMRSIIIDLIRERRTERRGGDLCRVTLDTVLGEQLAGAEDPVQVDDALSVLEQVEPRLAQVVEMIYFGGMTQAEVAEALACHERTVRRDWDKARIILKSMLC